MTPAGATTATDTTDEIGDAALFEGAESVRLELTVLESDARSAAEAVGMEPLDAHVRLVHFFDTPDLALLRAGLVVRARRRRGRDDTVVALRPATPRLLPRRLRRSAAFALAVGVPGGVPACTAWLKSRPEPGTVARVSAGDAPARGLFTKEQRDLFRARAPEGLGLDDLIPLGPLVVLRPKYTPDVGGRRLVGDLWMYPDGSRLLELATRCAPEEVAQASAELCAFLARYGVDATLAQQSAPERALTLLTRAAGALTTGGGMPPGWPTT